MTATGPVSPDAPLTAEVLREIAAPNSPVPLENLEELQRFLAAFSHDQTTKAVARALGLGPEKMDQRLRDHVHNRLFGPHSAWQANRQQGAQTDQSLLEPFFAIEAKAVLEHVTGNVGLFSA